MSRWSRPNHHVMDNVQIMVRKTSVSSPATIIRQVASLRTSRTHFLKAITPIRGKNRPPVIRHDFGGIHTVAHIIVGIGRHGPGRKACVGLSSHEIKGIAQTAFQKQILIHKRTIISFTWTTTTTQNPQLKGTSDELVGTRITTNSTGCILYHGLGNLFVGYTFLCHTEAKKGPQGQCQNQQITFTRNVRKGKLT